MNIEGMGYPVVGYLPAAYQPRLGMTVAAPASKPFITLGEIIGLSLGVGLGILGTVEGSPFFSGAGASFVAASIFAIIVRASSSSTTATS